VKGITLNRHTIRTGLIIGAFLFCAALLYATIDAYLDIRKLKDGSIWHIPSKIYSRPLSISKGMDIERSGLMDSLSRLRYRKVAKVTRPGDYARDAKGISLFIHEFVYLGQRYSALQVKILLDGRKVRAVFWPKSKGYIKSALLEPEIIAQISDGLNEDRTLVRLDQCPQYLIDALITTEDRRFYSHHGIDLRSLARAMLTNLKHGSIIEGGSTITQQLAKNLFLTHRRSVTRKLKDMWLALITDALYTKDEILSMYINEIYMGSYGHAGVCGLGKASRMLFDKGVSEISLSEAALMVAMIKAPNSYSPYTYPERALKRRNTVLEIMLKRCKISENDYKKARKTPIRVVPQVPGNRTAPYFIDHVVSLVKGNRISETALQRAGYQIYTTLDMHMQKTAEKMLAKGMSGKDSVIDAAEVVMDPKTGILRTQFTHAN